MYKDSWEVGGSIIPLLFSLLHAVSDKRSPISKTKPMYFFIFIPLIPFLILTRRAESTEGPLPSRVLQKRCTILKKTGSLRMEINGGNAAGYVGNRIALIIEGGQLKKDRRIYPER